MRKLSLSFVSVLALCSMLAACGSGAENGASGSSKPATGGSAAPASAGGSAKPAGGATKDVDLAPLALKLSLPSTEAGVTMDKTLDGRKSVGVSYDELSAGINVSEPREKSFDEVKKSVKGDTVMFPFKKFAEETATTAIAEVSADSKTAYTAWAWKEVGGKPYLCQSAGLAGLKSVEDAKKVLKACDTLAAK